MAFVQCVIGDHRDTAFRHPFHGEDWLQVGSMEEVDKGRCIAARLAGNYFVARTRSKKSKLSGKTRGTIPG